MIEKILNIFYCSFCTFDWFPYDQIIAKPNTYGFSLSSARFMQSYLSNRKQKTKINNTYSS